MGVESIDVATLAALLATVVSIVVHVAAARPHPPDRRHRRRLDHGGGAHRVVGARLDGVPRRRGTVAGGTRRRLQHRRQRRCWLIAVVRAGGSARGRGAGGAWLAVRRRCSDACSAVRRRSPRCSASPTPCSSHRRWSRRGGRGARAASPCRRGRCASIEAVLWGRLRPRPTAIRRWSCSASSALVESCGDPRSASAITRHRPPAVAVVGAPVASQPLDDAVVG